MKTIQLTQNMETIVSDTDFEYLNSMRWHALRHRDTYYAGSSVGGKHGSVLMHRLIMNIYDKASWIDHIDGNGLNNQRNNLRVCNRQQNQHNRKANRNSSSKYVGVALSTRRGEKRWLASIKFNNKQISLGIFPYTDDGEILAAKARDEAAKKMHGEFANLNFKANPQQ